MNDYVPIACGEHSRFELAIMRRWRLRLRWRDEHGESHLATLLPRDLETREGAEFMLAESIAQGDGVRIRLDRIDGWECLDGKL